MVRRKKTSAQRELKRLHPAYIVIIALALVIGLAGGYLVGNFMYGKDTLKLKGEKITYVQQGQSVSYSNEGIKYISGGKDLSRKVKIETNMTLVDGKYTGTPDSENELYIVYKITSGRAKGESLYRVFRISEDGGDGK